MPINFRKAKSSEARCSSCGTEAAKSVAMYEYKIGNSKGTLCDLCLKELFNKTLNITCMIDKEVKDTRQMNVINARKSSSKEESRESIKKINEALSGVEFKEDE